METEYFITQEEVLDKDKCCENKKTVFIVHACVGRVSVSRTEFSTIQDAFSHIQVAISYSSFR